MIERHDIERLIEPSRHAPDLFSLR
jgi:hypothetical protein